jgi:hypothetical protein
VEEAKGRRLETRSGAGDGLHNATEIFTNIHRLSLTLYLAVYAVHAKEYYGVQSIPTQPTNNQKPLVSFSYTHNIVLVMSSLLLRNLRRVWIPWVVGVRLGCSGNSALGQRLACSESHLARQKIYVHATAVFWIFMTPHSVIAAATPKGHSGRAICMEQRWK